MKHIAFGFILGIANIIPGVSGGTFALILGIYPKLLKAIGAYDTTFAKQLLTGIKNRQGRAIRTLLFTEQASFLAKLAVGTVASLLVLSNLIKYLLETRYELTYGFFLGLIIFSLAIPYRLLERKRGRDILWLLVGLGLTLFISIQVDPATKMLEKSAHYQALLSGSAQAALPGYTAGQFGVIFLVGLIATSAMVLPGISGSFVLLLLGKYYLVITTLSRLPHFYPDDVIFVLVLTAGCLTGMVAFVKLLNYVYEHAKNQTIWFLMGLMLGSVHALWPFKQFQLVDLYMKVNQAITAVPGYKLYGNRLRMFDSFGELWPVLLSFAAGGAIMMIFARFENGEQKNDAGHCQPCSPTSLTNRQPPKLD